MKKILILFLVFGVFATSFAEEMAPLSMPSTRGLGMGGTHVAFTDDVYALFVNPAALQKANQGSRFEFSPGFAGPLLGLIKLAGSVNDDLIGTLGDFAKDSGGRIPLGIDLRGPVSIAYTANGFGFGIWDRLSMDTQIVGVKKVSVSALADAIVNFGMSFDVLSLGNHEVDAGFVVKPFLRAMAGMNVAVLDMVGSNSAQNLVEKFNVPLIFGAGVDLGFMYRFHKDLSLGLTIDDVYTRGGKIATFKVDGASRNDGGVSSYEVPSTVNVGVAYNFHPFSAFGLALMVDYRDVANMFNVDDFSKKNPILNLGLGAELTLLQFLKLRVGLNEMLPAAGFGIAMGAFHIDAAIYGKELKNEPGDFSTYALDLSIAVRPETAKKKWFWSAPIVNSILRIEDASVSEEEPDRSAEAEAAAAEALQQF